MSVFLLLLLLTIAYAAVHQNALGSRPVLDMVKAECNSQYYCNSTSIKYMSLTQLNGTYLNATIIARNKTTTIANCQALCIRTYGCFSINIDISLSNELDCQLLSNNLYVNRSLLTRNPNFIHLFIKSPPCEKKKSCQNDAICIPSYANDSYSCQCKRNATFHSWGEHCKNLASGSQAADHFFSFDEFVSVKYIFALAKETFKNYKFEIINQHIGNNLVQMPGRHSPVVYCKSADNGGCFQLCRDLVGLNHLRGCEAGLTYSIWVKFTQEELNRNRKGVVFSHTGVGRETGVAFAAEASRSSGYNFQLANGVKFWEMNFAENVLAQRWTHFAITFHNDVGICGYVNGVLDKCGGSSSSRVSSLTSNSCFRLGFVSTSESISGIFLDDFAVWLSALTESDVKEVYNHGKA